MERNQSGAVTLGRVLLGNQEEKSNHFSRSQPQAAEDSPAALRSMIVNLRDELEQRTKRVNELEFALSECRNELDAAQSSLNGLLEDIDSQKKQAELRGYEEGIARSQQELHDSMAIQADAWKENIDRLFESHAEFCQNIKSQIADIVMAATVKIIGNRLTTPEAVKLGVDQIIAESGELQELKVFLPPPQYEQLTASLNATAIFVRGREVAIFPDNRIEYGGCILETANGMVDGRYEVQLSKLRDILKTSASEILK